MLLAHISDFHVFSELPETKMVRLDAADAARKVVNDIARFRPALDAVLFTGDLTDGGSAHDYALLADIVSPLKAPLLMVPGNHDKRAALRTAFAGRLPLEETRFLNYEAHVGALRVLALDTLIEGRTEGALERESLDWLATGLSRPHGGPTVVIMHHPPFPSGIGALDRMALVGGRTEMAEIVRSFKGPLTILAGHIHRPYNGLWNGAYCAVGGSPAFQVDLDLGTGVHEPGVVAEPYAYYVYRLGADGGVAAHRRFVAL